MLIEHDYVGTRSEFSNRAVALLCMIRWRDRSAREAQKDDLGRRSAVVLENAAVPAAEVSCVAAGVWRRRSQHFLDATALRRREPFGIARGPSLPVDFQTRQTVVRSYPGVRDLGPSLANIGFLEPLAWIEKKFLNVAFVDEALEQNAAKRGPSLGWIAIGRGKLQQIPEFEPGQQVVQIPLAILQVFGAIQFVVVIGRNQHGGVSAAGRIYRTNQVIPGACICSRRRDAPEMVTGGWRHLIRQPRQQAHPRVSKRDDLVGIGPGAELFGSNPSFDASGSRVDLNDRRIEPRMKNETFSGGEKQQCSCNPRSDT